jgi:hypothetical protein
LHVKETTVSNVSVALYRAREAQKQVQGLAAAVASTIGALERARTAPADLRGAAEALRGARVGTERALRDVQEQVDRVVDGL